MGFKLCSGVGIVVDDNVPLGQLFNTGHVTAIDIDHNQLVAGGKGGNIRHFIIIQIDMAQFHQIFQTGYCLNLVITAVNGAQGAAVGPFGKFGYLILGKIQQLKYRKLRQAGDICDVVVADVQFNQILTVTDHGYVSQAVVICGEMRQVGKIVDCAEGGKRIMTHIQPLQIHAGGDRRNGGQGVVGNIQFLQLGQTAEGAQTGQCVVVQHQTLQVHQRGQGLQIPDGVVAQVQIGDILGLFKTCRSGQIAVSKGKTLVSLGKLLGIKREEIMACGDGANDTDMIKEAGLGVAMANAVDVVKAVADVITAPNDEEGVAKAIEKYVLKHPGK